MSEDSSSALRLITPPAAEPLTLTQAKAFLRIEHTADDISITGAIGAARHYAETYLGRALLPQTWEYSIANSNHTVLRLPIGPVQSISSVTLTNEAGTNTVVNTVNYRASVDGFSVRFSNLAPAETLTVRYVAASYTEATAVPAALIQGMLHHIAVMIEGRDGSAALPVQALQCYQPFRRVRL